MATNSQTKFFEILERKASAHNLQLLVDKTYSNTGLLHLQDPGSFETALTLPFSFQTGYATFGWMAGDGHPEVFPERGNPYFARYEPSEFDSAIEAILKAASR